MVCQKRKRDDRVGSRTDYELARKFLKKPDGGSAPGPVLPGSSASAEGHSRMDDHPNDLVADEVVAEPSAEPMADVMPPTPNDGDGIGPRPESVPPAVTPVISRSCDEQQVQGLGHHQASEPPKVSQPSCR